MVLDNLIRGIVKKNPYLKLKLKKADSKLSTFQYIYQTISMTGLTIISFIILCFLVFKSNIIFFLYSLIFCIILIPFIYKFWLSVVDVQIRRHSRELDSDLLFVSEYLLVSLESGLPIGNSIENLSKLNRPGGRFFKRIYIEFKTGKSFDKALEEGIRFSPNENIKNLIKKLKDSINIGVDLRKVLINYIEDSNEKKIVEIKAFSKKLNPIIMMYLLFGVVLPSLGVTFFIIGATLLEMTPAMLKFILIFIFLIMFGFQYLSYTIFKFSKTTI